MKNNSIQLKLDKLIKSYKKKHNLFTRKQSELKSIETELNTLQKEIDFFDKSLAIKPHILYNQGRDKKYIYGQVYHFISPQSDKKKSYRFLIGKMDEGKSRSELEQICIQKFMEKVIED